jgi:hypothetical protein
MNDKSWIRQALNTAKTAQQAKKLLLCQSVSEGEKLTA